MRRIILDTDLAMGAPGSDIDDGFALALALADPELDVDLVTTVNGNTDVDTATLLCLELLHRLGRTDVPVVRGASRPLLRPLHDTPARQRVRDVREQVPAREPAPGQAAAAIVEHVMASPGEITLVPIGPLTNVALALAMEPRVAQNVKAVVCMGGVFLEHTNRAGMPGEFNIWVDPDAAAVVLRSGAPLRFVGLDVTLQVRLTRAHAAQLAAGGSDFGTFAGEYTQGWIDHLEKHVPGDPREHGSCAMHDPLAVAVVSRPDLVTWRPAYVQVEARGDVARGVTIADLLTTDDPPAANCEIATAVDVDAFTSLFLERISAL
jgi:purine nucleosidase